MAIEDQQPVFALYLRCCVVVKMLNPIQTYCISSLAIVGSCDTPNGREVTLGIPVSEVVLRS
jgi:hypothetical protein